MVVYIKYTITLKIILIYIIKYYILHYNTNVPIQLGGKGDDSLILHTDGTKPIYIQISEWLETEILTGSFDTDEKIYSQYKLAEMFNINPATAAKGLKLLADEGILYDKRGIGKFVSSDANKIIRDKRKNQILTGLIQEILIEARHLKIDEKELIDMIKTVNQKTKGDK